MGRAAAAAQPWRPRSMTSSVSSLPVEVGLGLGRVDDGRGRRSRGRCRHRGLRDCVTADMGAFHSEIRNPTSEIYDGRDVDDADGLGLAQPQA